MMYGYRCKDKEGQKMRDFADGVFAYTVGFFATFSTVLWTHANEITTVGGFLVLALRLYVDGSRAYRKWRGRDDY